MREAGCEGWQTGHSGGMAGVGMFLGSAGLQREVTRQAPV